MPGTRAPFALTWKLEPLIVAGLIASLKVALIAVVDTDTPVWVLIGEVAITVGGVTSPVWFSPQADTSAAINISANQLPIVLK